MMKQKPPASGHGGNDGAKLYGAARIRANNAASKLVKGRGHSARRNGAWFEGPGTKAKKPDPRPPPGGRY